MSTTPTKRSGGRSNRRAARLEATLQPIQTIVSRIPPYEMASEEVLSLIENNAEILLEEIGIDFLDDEEVLHIWKQAGAEVEGSRVRMPQGMCRSIITQHAPNTFTWHARNAERSVTVGGKHRLFAPAYGPPFVRDLEQGRRYATFQDFKNFVSLAYQSNVLDVSGGTVCEPVDLPVNHRHLDMVYAHLRYSDKPFMGSVTSQSRAEDTLEMTRIAFGKDYVDNHCVLLSLINVNSPMTYDHAMLGALKAYAKAGQGLLITPFIISGAMSPAAVVATATQVLAEAMAGIALAQLIRPGVGCVLGQFGAAMSMRSGAPTFGGPEPSLVLYLMAQLSRRLGLPFRSGGNLTASKVPDAQAAYESANTFQTAVLAGVHYMLHAAGWLEGGLVMGYEKFIMDLDQVGMMRKMHLGADASENGQAMDAFREVGPGSHFLNSAHTHQNYQDAFYLSDIADSNSFEQWQAEGSTTLEQRCHQRYKQALAQYEPPALDPALDAELQSFMTRRKKELDPDQI